jgi:predicted anti-sigma-YlaC factor YlaD
MKCSLAREALSARIDGEREPVSARSVDEHLCGCSDCRLWYTRAFDHSQRLDEMAQRCGLRAQLPSSVEPFGDDRRRAVPVPVVAWCRWSLALVGVLMLVITVFQMAVPGRRGDVAALHLVGESAAWSIAIGAAMIFAAVSPAAAAGLTGVLVAYAGVLTVYVVVDATRGAVSPAQELGHLPVVVGAVLAFLLWRGTRSPRPAPRGAGTLEPEQDSALQPAITGPAGLRKLPQGGSAA